MKTTRIKTSALLGGALLAAAAQAAVKQPNVLLIMADDFGAGCINAYGASKEMVRTPHLNRLAEEGMLFTNANAPASVCSPTRYAMLTGRYAWRGPYPFAVAAIRPASIRPEDPTVASLMKSKGYRTAAIGKWHIGYGDPGGDNAPDLLQDGVFSPGPNDIGFDYHFGIPGNLDDRWRIWIENDGIYGLRSKKFSPYAKSFYGRQYDGFDAPQRSREKAMEELTTRAVEWIRADCRDESAPPFFLYFSPPATHHPIVPSEEMRGTSGCGAYGDFIHDLDRSVGRLIDTLAYEGILDDTLVIFTADNGSDIPDDPARPECQAREAGLLSNGPLRGDKHVIYEGGLRIPLMVRWPGRVKAGTVNHHMVNLVDVYATLLEAFGNRPLAEGEAPDSISFLPTLLGKTQPQRKPMICDNVGGILALRDGAWKFIEGKFPDSMPENHGLRNACSSEAVPALYNLEKDPAEQNNVIADYPEKVKAMQEILDEYRDAGSSR
jgi:arylsulfatase A-like enzyme